jgi:hypothetical protein
VACRPPRAIDPFAICGLAPRPVAVPAPRLCKDQTPFWNELTLSPVFDESGSLTNFVGVQTDVTERRQAEAEIAAAKAAAEEANRAKSRIELSLDHGDASAMGDRIARK